MFIDKSGLSVPVIGNFELKTIDQSSERERCGCACCNKSYLLVYCDHCTCNQLKVCLLCSLGVLHVHSGGEARGGHSRQKGDFLYPIRRDFDITELFLLLRLSYSVAGSRRICYFLPLGFRL
jgi:hypothetical protein